MKLIKIGEYIFIYYSFGIWYRRIHYVVHYCRWFMLGLFFGSEDGSDMSLRNFRLSLKYTAFQPYDLLLKKSFQLLT